LLDSLKTYLDGIKVLPTTVTVVSGFAGVRTVNTTVNVVVQLGFNPDVIVSAVTSAIQSLFVGINFGSALMLSKAGDLTNPTVIPGIVDRNVQFSATRYVNNASQSMVDIYGNVVPTTTEILSIGTITVNVVKNVNYL
jgi:hypothetical protein